MKHAFGLRPGRSLHLGQTVQLALACTLLLSCRVGPLGLEWPDFTAPGTGSALQLEVVRDEPTGETEPSPLLGILRREAERAMEQLAELGDPKPYFVSYQVTDEARLSINASLGALERSERKQTRMLDVDLRVGDPTFDNTHPARGSDLLISGRRSHPTWQLPIEDDPEMLQRTLWVALDTQYRKALAEYLKVKGNLSVRTETDLAADDFSREPPVRFISRRPRELDSADTEALEDLARELSSAFRDRTDIFRSSVSFSAIDVTRTLVNSEGSSVQTTRGYGTLIISGATRSTDGMELSRSEILRVSLPPTADEVRQIRKDLERVIRDLYALRSAPAATPFVGPAILDGTAAGVFAHEVLGHRLEGHRQKADDEGQTFTRKVGERIMPDFIDIYDDPTISRLNGEPLNGHYHIDDEAVPSMRASLVEDGVLTGFLLSRSPVPGFDRSNGHGRRQPGNPIVARQGNLIVHPKRTVSPSELKQMLIQEVRRQDLPFGLRFQIVTGGFTNTSRFGVQAFRVNPVMVYRVYPDGREELVRGVTIDGTPLAALSQIIAAGDDLEIFNGTCGAESGWVPVSAASPSLLLRKVETSGVFSMRNSPPILPAPSPGDQP